MAMQADALRAAAACECQNGGYGGAPAFGRGKVPLGGCRVPGVKEVSFITGLKGGGDGFPERGFENRL